MVPAGTPADIVQKINAVTNRYLQSAKGKDLIARQALEPVAARRPTPRRSSGERSKVGAGDQGGEYFAQLTQLYF